MPEKTEERHEIPIESNIQYMMVAFASKIGYVLLLYACGSTHREGSFMLLLLLVNVNGIDVC